MSSRAIKPAKDERHRKPEQQNQGYLTRLVIVFQQRDQGANQGHKRSIRPKRIAHDSLDHENLLAPLQGILQLYTGA